VGARALRASRSARESRQWARCGRDRQGGAPSGLTERSGSTWTSCAGRKAHLWDVRLLVHSGGAGRPAPGWRPPAPRRIPPAVGGRDLLLHALVRPGGVEGEHELAQDAPEVGLAEDEQVVQALLPHRAQKSLADRVRSRCSGGRGYQVDAGGLGDAGEDRPVLAVMVEDEVLGVLTERSGFTQLLGHPGVGRVSGDADVYHSTRADLDQEEGVEWPEEPVGDREEAGGPEVAAVIGQEGGPGWARAARRACPPADSARWSTWRPGSAA
jgi:hypothetical protein